MCAGNRSALLHADQLWLCRWLQVPLITEGNNCYNYLGRIGGLTYQAASSGGFGRR
jgi:hypothetical protein